MSDYVHVEHGQPPWSPSSTTAVKEVLHRYTVPLVGVFEQEGIDFLFFCVVGHAAPDNAWGYVRVDNDSELSDLREADGEHFDDALRALVKDRVCRFVIASDEEGIIESVTLDPPASFDDVHTRGMEEMGNKFQEAFAEFQVLQERFPLLRSAASFNVVPSPKASAV